jgi:hypothetical protein
VNKSEFCVGSTNSDFILSSRDIENKANQILRGIQTLERDAVQPSKSYILERLLNDAEESLSEFLVTRESEPYDDALPRKFAEQARLTAPSTRLSVSSTGKTLIDRWNTPALRLERHELIFQARGLAHCMAQSPWRSLV